MMKVKILHECDFTVDLILCAHTGTTSGFVFRFLFFIRAQKLVFECLVQQPTIQLVFPNSLLGVFEHT